MKLKQVLRIVEEAEASPDAARRRYRWVRVSDGSGHYIWDVRENRPVTSSRRARTIDPDELLEDDDKVRS